MPSGRASVHFPQRWRVAHGIPTLARGNEKWHCYKAGGAYSPPYQEGVVELTVRKVSELPSGRASVPFPQRWRVAHGIPTLARGNEINEIKI